MATAEVIITDALRETGAWGPGETPDANWLAFGLTRLTNQINAWAADRLTIYVTTRTLYTLPSGTSTVTIGPTGTINITVRPMWWIGVNYVVPGTNPAVETPMGQMDDNSYMNLSIKGLSSNLPTQWYYNETFPLGTLFFWPTISQNVQLALYYPQQTVEPTALSDDLIGPPGWQEAMMYGLALRLWTPARGPVELPPLLVKNAAESYATMVRPNIQPPLLGIDNALVPMGGGGYNVLNDQLVSPSNR